MNRLQGGTLTTLAVMGRDSYRVEALLSLAQRQHRPPSPSTKQHVTLDAVRQKEWKGGGNMRRVALSIQSLLILLHSWGFSSGLLY